MYFLYKTNCRGLTSVEVMVSSLIVGVVVVGSLNALSGSVRTQRVATESMVGPMLAEELLAEILSQEYEDPQDGGATLGTDSGELSGNRTHWDDLDDYDGWSSNPPEQDNGTQLTAFSDWTRTVTVVWASRLDGNPWATDTGLKRIEVRAVYDAGGANEVIFSRNAYRCRWGALEQPYPGDATTVTTHIKTEIDLGNGPIRWNTPLLNHVKSPN